MDTLSRAVPTLSRRLCSRSSHPPPEYFRFRRLGGDALRMISNGSNIVGDIRLKLSVLMRRSIEEVKILERDLTLLMLSSVHFEPISQAFNVRTEEIGRMHCHKVERADDESIASIINIVRFRDSSGLGITVGMSSSGGPTMGEGEGRSTISCMMTLFRQGRAVKRPMNIRGLSLPHCNWLYRPASRHVRQRKV